jgi:hypothetical protein
MEQKHFQFGQQYYKQTKRRLAIGAPTSTILAETYLQHMENKQIYPILIKQQTSCFRYVDDIVIIYDQNKTNNTEQTLDEVNKLQPSTKFTIEKGL